MVTVHACGSDFDLQNTYLENEMQQSACHPSTAEADAGGSLKLISPTSEPQV